MRGILFGVMVGILIGWASGYAFLRYEAHKSEQAIAAFMDNLHKGGKLPTP